MNIYAIYDKKSGSYFSLSLHKNDALYKRSLSALANDKNPDNLFATHSSDFELYSLGVLDERSGAISPELRFVCSAADLKDE